MVDTTQQRSYVAACPGCGAPVEFRSAQSTHAVCSFCTSVLVRQGETLRRRGKVADVFADYSPLQLGVTGVHRGVSFRIVGRLQYRFGESSWTEWQTAFSDGRLGSLAEDNGAFVLCFAAAPGREAPPPEQLRPGAVTAFQGKRYTVTSNESVRLSAAEGELGRLPDPDRTFPLVELRSDDGEVLSLDYGQAPVSAWRGRAVDLENLALAGLRESSSQTSNARSFQCPQCGAPVEVRLATSRSVTCGACHSIISLTEGIGGELRHALQSEPVQPLIALGSRAKLQGTDWQVVGFQHRIGWDPSESDERFGWSEYLLFNRKRGFMFLVDAQDGWSVVKPTTGAPTVGRSGSVATYLGTRYVLRENYDAETDYVAGEFYWPVARGQRSSNSDFHADRRLLHRERAGREIAWSSGSRIEGADVARAFGKAGEAGLFERRDAGIGAFRLPSLVVLLLALLLLLVLLGMLRACQDCDPRRENCSSGGGGGSSGRTAGGSWGGASSGGSHK